MINVRIPCLVAVLLGISASSSACLQSGPPVGRAADTAEGAESLLSSHRHVLRSSVLGEDRVIRVVEPEMAGPGRVTYPTIYVLDGEANLAAVAMAARHLATYLRIPETIVVAVHNTRREPDLNPPGLARALPGGGTARGDRFLDFLGSELIPFVEGTYPANGLRILLGHSQGGLFAAYAMADGRGLFPWALALDAPMEVPAFAPVVTALEERTGSGPPGRLFSGVASYGWSDDQWSRLHPEDGGFAWSRQDIVPDESHQTMVLSGTLAGLKGLFSDYPVPTPYPQTVAEIDSVFSALGQTYGASMSPPLDYLTRMAADLLLLRQGSEALAVVREAAALYGDSERLAGLRERADALVAEGEAGGDDQETLRGLLALPREDPGALRPFLGRWTGTAVHEGGVPMDLVLDLTEVGGEVEARFQMHIGDFGGPLEVSYLQVDDHGTLEFGYLNQRRPGGLIVSMMRLVGSGRMEGVQEVRGVDFEAMFGPGRRPAVTHVTLERTSRL